ncbi:MAG: glycosyltransferase family 4 protein [Candidatus Odinarchaeota archaeon]
MSSVEGLLFIKESFDTYRGGIEGKILTIAKYLHEKKIYKPYLLTSDPNSLFAEEFSRLGFNVYSVSMKHIWSTRKTLVKTIDNIVNNDNISIIQSHAFRESLIGRLYKKYNPDVIHVSRIHTHIAGSTISKARIFLYYKLDKLTAKYADCFVTISKVLKNELIEKSKINPEKIEVVYNGIDEIGDPDILTNSEDKLDQQIAIIGEIEERKQQFLAVKAINALKSENIQVKLHLIGRAHDKYLIEIEDYIKSNNLVNHVVFHGQIKHSEIYQIIRPIPVVILPSLFEGVPTSIIEAMSLNKIVVSTDTGGTKELINHNNNGFLHQPSDLKGLINILRDIFSKSNQEFNKLRENARETYLSNFTTESMMNGLISIYSKLTFK